MANQREYLMQSGEVATWLRVQASRDLPRHIPHLVIIAGKRKTYFYYSKYVYALASSTRAAALTPRSALVFWQTRGALIHREGTAWLKGRLAQHESYGPTTLSNLLDVTRQTVRNWIRSGVFGEVGGSRFRPLISKDAIHKTLVWVSPWSRGFLGTSQAGVRLGGLNRGQLYDLGGQLPSLHVVRARSAHHLYPTSYIDALAAYLHRQGVTGATRSTVRAFNRTTEAQLILKETREALRIALWAKNSFSVRELAELLGTTRKTIISWCHDGTFQGVTGTKELSIPASAVRNALRWKNATN